MVQSNHSALSQGLKLYTDAMRRLIKQRLIASYPNDWWRQGVLSSLQEIQRRNLEREANRDPNRDKADFLDPTHFVAIVTRQFDRVFAEAFHDFKKTQAWLLGIDVARNAVAHPISGDLAFDDVATYLYDMINLLRLAELPEVDDVERLRNQVMGVPATEHAEPVTETPPPTSSKSSTGMPYWWEVCEPHDGFKNPSNIDESRFAASLGRVFAGAASSEYLDPVAFLSQTYFTENLTQMTWEIASRLRGGDGASVTEVQTPFGGGKTHALLTFYHLVNSPREAMSVPEVQEALGGFSIPSNARVLVFDGQEHGVDPVNKENGVSVSTMWGELTSQVDAGLYRRLIMDSDGKGEAPGNAVFGQVLEAASPCLILIDEVVSYLVKLRYSNSRRTQNLYRQTVQFLQETLQLAGNVPGVCVLLSLPKSRQEFGGLDPQQLQRDLQIMEELQPRADRVVSKRTPVNDDEIYLLMSRRLFKRADATAAQAVAQAHRAIYEKTPGQYDSMVRSADYLKQQIAAYPFHPELIDVLYKKWSTSSDFPRTRAVLQLLASIVADQWANAREAYTIQSSHVNLERERIRTRIVSAAGSGGGYDAVVASDIIGGDAHADYQDNSRGGEYTEFRIARGVATTLLLHSFGGRMQTGAVPQELRLGTVAPNVGPEYVTEVLGTLEQSLWYVHRDGELLKFQTRPNIYRVIAQTADNQSPSVVADRLREGLDRVAGNSPGFRVITWAGGDGVIPDTPEPTIALLDPRFSIEAADASSSPANQQAIERLWDRVGGGLREYRNSLLLVASDAELWGNAEEAVREVLAYDAVIGGRAAEQLSEVERADLTSRRRDKQDSLATSIVTAFRWVFYPSDNGLESVALSVPATKGQHVANRAVDRLSDQNYGNPKILKAVGAVYFKSRIGPRLWKTESEPLDLSEALRRFPQWTFLPILPIREQTLRDCIREGIAQNLWAVAIGDNRTMTYLQLIDSADALDQLGALFDGSASLVAGDLLVLIREELGGAAETSPPGSDESKPVPGGTEEGVREKRPPPDIPSPKRFNRVRLSVSDLAVAKTNNLQPYLFKFIQEQDAGAEINVSIEVSSSAGISQETLEWRIVEGLDQLGITVTWEEG